MRLFSKFRKKLDLKMPPAYVPEGHLVYAIGDIHGRDDLFAELLFKIEQDRHARAHDCCVLILIGDLVDRGPDSDRVVERAAGLAPVFDRFHHLTGNHEECMLAALNDDLNALKYFYRIGGESTIRSYLRDDALFNDASFEDLVELFPRAVPRHHLDFLGRGEDMVEYGDFVFVHAGVRPGDPLDRQKTSDLRWIRGPFLDSKENFGRIVVHGHTISDEPELRSNRIGIDTGAYASGRLTAVALSGGDRWFLATGKD